MSEDNHPKKWLADDPTFLESLAELDRGIPEARPASQTFADVQPEPRPTCSVPEPPPAGPPISFDFPEITPPQPAPVAPPPATGSRRPLIDLFPPLATEFPRPPVPNLPPPEPPRAELQPLPPLEPPRARPLARPPIPVESAPYDTFYGLTEQPFSPSTDPRFFYHSNEHDRVTQELLGAIGRREAVVVMTGELGVGKTISARVVIEQLDRRTLTCFITEPFASTEDFLKTVLVDFGVIHRDDVTSGRLSYASRAELIAALRDFFFSLAPLQAFAVLMIDDAHDLPIDVLEQIRLIAEAAGEASLLQVMLIGQPSLTKTLARSELRDLNRRVTVRTRLLPLGADEMAAYVMHRVAVAGTSPRLEFDDRALKQLYELSGGVPRVINLLCDRALAAGQGVSASVIDEALVKSASDDLDLAPAVTQSSMPWIVGMIGTIVLLMLLGAAAAGFIFGADLSNLVEQWQGVPSPPPRPRLALPAPLTPRTLPARDDRPGQ